METKRDTRLNSWLLKLVFSMVVAAVFFVASGFMSEATVVQTKEDDRAATIKWDNKTSTDYSIGYAKVVDNKTGDAYMKAKKMAESRKCLIPGSAKAYTIKGLSLSSQYVVVLRYSLGTGKYLSYSDTSNYYVYTKLQKVSGVTQEKWWCILENVDVKWKEQPNAKYEVVFMNKAGKAVKRYTGKNALYYAHASYNDVKNTNTYKVRVRAIREPSSYNSTVKKYASKWSDDCYLFTQPIVKSAKVSGGKLTLTWNKVQGMNKYNVYVSTKEKSGYKKVASVKKNSVTIAKLGKKKFSASKTYYVYIVGNMKVGKKTYNSGKHYTNTVKNGTTPKLNWTF